MDLTGVFVWSVVPVGIESSDTTPEYTAKAGWRCSSDDMQIM
jgi:hypothetical protein